MKNILLLSMALVACHKGNEPKPTKSEINQPSEYHTLLVRDNTSLTSNLYINGVRQESIKNAITVKNGDTIQVDNVGEDTWVGAVKTDSYVSVQVYLDNKAIYNSSCDCDVLFNRLIN